MVAMVREHRLEGVIAKRLDSRYEAGRRSGAWAKMRVNLSQEFVVGGLTPGSIGFDSLVIGFYRPKPRASLPPSRRQYVVPPRELVYCARVRAGFVPASRREITARLKPLITSRCPFANLPEASAGRWGQGLTAEKMKSCIWVQPQLVIECTFLEWTPNDHLRHVRFLGIREDKAALDVVKET
jgi:bifunctional non-homologous end joining protein LigD